MRARNYATGGAVIAFVFLLLSVLLLAEALQGPRRSGRARTSFGVAGVLCGIITLVLVLGAGRVAQTIALLAMPAGLLWFVGLGLAALLTAHRRKRAAATTWALWLVYTMVGNVSLGGMLLYTTERQYADVDPFASTYDVVFVLGGGTATRKNYHFLGSSGDRVALGARLWHEGNTPLLVTTGSTPESSKSPHNSAQSTAEIWTSLGIPPDHILAIARPTNTREELDVIQELQEEHGWENIGVVSSARHLPRVMRNADKRSITLQPLPADYRAAGAGSIFQLSVVVPSGPGFLLVHTFVWEWLARAVGH